MKRKPILMLIATLLALGMAGGSTFPRKAGSAASGAAPQTEPLDTSAAPSPSPASLTGISIRAAEDGKGTVVDVTTSEAIPYKVHHLSNPNRLVLDLEGAVNATHRWKYSAAAPGLLRVRLGRFSEEHGGVVRVVADLDGDPAANVLKETTG
jgi:hypothetical protein